MGLDWRHLINEAKQSYHQECEIKDMEVESKWKDYIIQEKLKFHS